jgi:hypothetical protein
LDIWLPNSLLKPAARALVQGYTPVIPGICGSEKYSIMENNGFNNILMAAHELGHR